MAAQMTRGNPDPGRSPPPVPRACLGIAHAIGRVNRGVGNAVAWFALAMVVIQAALVIGRYVFGIGSIALQESVLYMHGLLFTLAAGYALVDDGHVRVDIFYRAARPRTRAAIDLAGVVILLLPFMAAIGWTAWPYVLESWRTLEGSRETSGLAYLYVVKTGILAMAALVALQGLALALKAVARLTDPAAPDDIAP